MEDDYRNVRKASYQGPILPESSADSPLLTSSRRTSVQSARPQRVIRFWSNAGPPWMTELARTLEAAGKSTAGTQNDARARGRATGAPYPSCAPIPYSISASQTRISVKHTGSQCAPMDAHSERQRLAYLPQGGDARAVEPPRTQQLGSPKRPQMGTNQIGLASA